jgi:hypothetical protein
MESPQVDHLQGNYQTQINSFYIGIGYLRQKPQSWGKTGDHNGSPGKWGRKRIVSTAVDGTAWMLHVIVVRVVEREKNLGCGRTVGSRNGVFHRAGIQMQDLNLVQEEPYVRSVHDAPAWRVGTSWIFPT